MKKNGYILTILAIVTCNLLIFGWFITAIWNLFANHFGFFTLTYLGGMLLWTLVVVILIFRPSGK